MNGSLLSRLHAIGLLAVCTGCAGTLDDPARFADAAGIEAGLAGSLSPDGAAGGAGLAGDARSVCPDAANGILGPTCAVGGCHDAQDKVQGLDLQSPDLFARLAGVQAHEGPGLLIDRASPSRSILYAKLTSVPPFGARMPLRGTLDDAMVACVLTWITEESRDAGISEGGSDVGVGGE